MNGEEGSPDQDNNNDYGEEDEATDLTTEDDHSPPTLSVRNPIEVLVDWWKTLIPGEEPPLSHIVKQSLHPQRQQQPYKTLAAVTLYFDEITNGTIAVLSEPACTGILSVYWKCQVDEGTAKQHSALYYTLPGYVREHFHKIQPAIHPHGVHLAVGALEASDRAQLVHLQTQRQAKMIQASGTTPTVDANLSLMEQALEVARLHRLQEDLDVLSLFFLASTCRTLRRLAARILRFQRQHVWSITILPYVDGAHVAGYSRLTRPNEHNLVIHTEAGRSVLYRACAKVLLVPAAHRNMDCDSRGHEMIHHNSYVPAPNEKGASTFTWECEEMALAHLHHWGDIAERDYVGQKVMIQWKAHARDETVLLDTLCLQAGPRRGLYSWKTLKTKALLEIQESETRAIDNVTLHYRGRARILSVEVPLVTLLQWTAKTELHRLRTQYSRIQECRPLLPHETEYCEHIEGLADMYNNATKSGKYSMADGSRKRYNDI